MRLEYLHPHRVYEAVDSGQADLGLVSYPEESTSLAAIAWRTEPMVLVCHPAASARRQRRASRSKALHGEAVRRVSSGPGDSRRDRPRARAATTSRCNVALEFDNIETIKRAIEIGAGVSLLPEPTVAREIASGTLVQSSARRPAARAAAGHHSSPRPQAERNGPAVHPVAAIAGGRVEPSPATATYRGSRESHGHAVEPVGSRIDRLVDRSHRSPARRH